MGVDRTDYASPSQNNGSKNNDAFRCRAVESVTSKTREFSRLILQMHIFLGIGKDDFYFAPARGVK